MSAFRFDYPINSFQLLTRSEQETKVDSIRNLEDGLVHVDGYESFWSFSRVKKGPVRSTARETVAHLFLRQASAELPLLRERVLFTTHKRNLTRKYLIARAELSGQARDLSILTTPLT